MVEQNKPKQDFYQTPSGAFSGFGYIFDSKGNIKGKVTSPNTVKTYNSQEQQIANQEAKQIQNNKPTPQPNQQNQANTIEEQRQAKINEARQNYANNRNISQFRETVAMANLEAGNKRVNAGLSTSFKRYGVRVGNDKAVIENSTDKSQVGKVYSIGNTPTQQPSQTQPTQNKPINTQVNIPQQQGGSIQVWYKTNVLNPLKDQFEKFKQQSPLFTVIRGAENTASSIIKPIVQYVTLGVPGGSVGREAPIIKPILQAIEEKPLTTFTQVYVTNKLLTPKTLNEINPLAKQQIKIEQLQEGVALRELKQPYFNEEVSFTRINKEGVVEQVNKYSPIITETRPPVIKADLNRGVIETIQEIQTPKIKVTMAVNGEIINNQPYMAVTMRPGGKSMYFQNVGGVTQDVNTFEIPQFTNVEQYTVKELLRSTGGPTDLSSFNRGVILTEKVGKIGVFNEYYDKAGVLTKVPTKIEAFNVIPEETISLPNIKSYAGSGSTVDTYFQLGENRVIFQTEEKTIYNTQTFFKNINSPFARASGNIPSLSGRLVVFEEPVIEAGGISKTINLGKVGGDSSQLSASLKASTIPVNKPIPPIQTNTFKTLEQLNKLSGSNIKLGSAISSSLSLSSALPTIQNKGSTLNVKTNTIQTQSNNLLQSNYPLIKNINVYANSPIDRTINDTSNKLVNKQIDKQIDKLVDKQIDKQTNKQTNKLINKLVSKNVDKETGLFLPTYSGQRQSPKGVVGIKKLLGDSGFNSNSLAIVQIRRKGKFKTIGVGNPLKVFNIGRTKTANTLGATFRVLGASDLPTPKGFYKSKKGQNTFIELPKLRLSTIGEKTEIRGARLMKLGKIKI